LRGCRCIEIDVWDGDERKVESEEEEERESHGIRGHIRNAFRKHKKSPSREHEEVKVDEMAMPTKWTTTTSETRAEPRVVHGYTLTKEVSFRAVCESIRESAFVTTDLPIIASLEVHAGQEQQDIMVEIMESTWKGMLVPAPPANAERLPTVEELRGKILVKVKAAPKEPPPLAAEQAVAARQVASSSSSSSSSESESDARPKSKKKVEKKSKIVDALSSLGIYTKSYHFKGLDAPEAAIPTHVFSLSEKKVKEVHADQGPALFSHNKKFLMRTYPGECSLHAGEDWANRRAAGTRVSSSNLDPSMYWGRGVQMVALNWQRFDAVRLLAFAITISC
jgi:hypothetical protein